MNLAIGLTLCTSGLILLYLAVRQYMKKGAVICPAYFTANEEERASMRCDKTYKLAGGMMLEKAVPVLCFGFYFIFRLSVFAYVGACTIFANILRNLLYMLMNDVK